MIRAALTVLLALVLLSAAAHEPAPPPAAAIASAHPLATAAGLATLAQGGNAFDAAIAVTATLAVVEPSGSGLGGGGFYLLHRAADGQDVFLDARERAPLAAHRDMYLDAEGELVPGLSMDGPLAAGIPGIPAALGHLAAGYGALPLAVSLAPAIELARNGFTVDARLHRYIGLRLNALRRSPGAAAVYLDGDAPLAAGARLRQPGLARTLGMLAEEGTDAFYEGDFARRLVAGVREAGGIWSERDLSTYRVVERVPIRVGYRGLTVVSAPPPSSGGIALATMLNILAGFDLSALGPTTRRHVLAEAMRRAYRDRAEYLGDPDQVAVPVARLTSPGYAEGLRATIDLRAATPSATLAPAVEGHEGTNTTHFSILDLAGNRVAATLSINYPLGSAFMVPGTDVLLNDEMDDFAAKPGAPNAYGLIGAQANAIAPGKRMLSSMSPTFVVGEKGVAVLGTPGGSRIISMVLLGILELAADGGAQSMVERPRFHHQYLPDVLAYEAGTLTEAERDALVALGHNLEAVDPDWYGNMQVVVWNLAAGTVEAASDPRGLGAAAVCQRNALEACAAAWLPGTARHAMPPRPIETMPASPAL
jgi:gamma-glutamyltranspeptidase/glutathione hydrolase